MLPIALDLGGEIGPVPEGDVLIPHVSGREDSRNLLKNRNLRDTGGGLDFFHMLSPVTNNPQILSSLLLRSGLASEKVHSWAFVKKTKKEY